MPSAGCQAQIPEGYGPGDEPRAEQQVVSRASPMRRESGVAGFEDFAGGSSLVELVPLFS